jgi:hypothetical protein
MKITAIKTKEGYYLSANLINYGDSKLSTFLFNGKLPEPTFDNKWIFVEATSEPMLIEREVSQPAINHRYELIDKSMSTDKIKEVFPRDVVSEYGEGRYGRQWKKEYAHLESLYELKSDEQPKIKELVDYALDVVLEIDEIKKHKGFSYQVQKTNWEHGETNSLTEKNIRHQIIDRILFPSIVLTSKPCKLDSMQTYKIVRQYIKDNINPKYAEITSDYNFCFTVKKRLEFFEPEKYSVDVNNSIFSSGKRKPKIVERYRKARLTDTIFEMTHAGDKYKGYTIIQGFEGKDQTDLKQKIDFYLENLIEFINKPLVDCPACKGLGVIKDKSMSQA